MQKNSNKLKSTTSNSITALELFEQLEDYKKQRKVWEDTLLKHSNNMLYEIIAKCLHLYQQVISDKALNRQLRQLLENKNFTITDGTSLATVVVRYVFGNSCSSTYAYANVLKTAHAANIDALALPNWIISQGGIENIRKSKSKLKLPSKSELKDSAIEVYASKKPIAKISSKSSNLAPNENAKHSFSAALVRQSQNGSFEIVYASNNTTSVNTLLADAGLSLHKQSNAQSTANATTIQASNVNNAISKTIEEKS